eukprot:789340_1
MSSVSSWVVMCLCLLLVVTINGKPCTNIDSDVEGECCGHSPNKCCKSLSMKDCVAKGKDSQCGWFYNDNDGCGYCFDWGSEEKCGEFNFNHEWSVGQFTADGHCDPNGVVNRDG